MSIELKDSFRYAILAAALVTMTTAGCAPKNSASPLSTPGDAQAGAAQPMPLGGGIGPEQLPPPPPPPVPMTVPQGLRDRSHEILIASARSDEAMVRVHAMESIRRTTGDADAVAVLDGLADKKPNVRAASLLAVGELGLSAGATSARALANDSNLIVQTTSRFALHRLGDTSRSQDLVTLAANPNPRVRGTAASVLGMLEEPSALNVLRPMQADPDINVRFEVAEALWRLGDDSGLQTLIGATVSLYPEDQISGLLGMLGRPDPRLIQHARMSLTSSYPEVQLVAARVCGMMGHDDGYTVAKTHIDDPDPRRRMIAAFALGAIARPDAHPLLEPLLADSEADVRLAAATAILMLK